MQLSRVNASLEPRWDDYVGSRTLTVTDLAGWRHVVHQAYGLRSHFFVALDTGRVVGAIALFEFKHPLFGHYLTTAAFSNDGGLYYDAPNVRDLLVTEAKRLADELDVAYLLIRTRGVEIDGFDVDRHYRTAVVDLEGGADSVWKDTLRAKARNQVRRGQNEGFTLHAGHDQFPAFYRLFHRHMRDLGSPAHGSRFYEAIIEHLSDRARFIVARDGEAPVAGALLFEVNGTASNYHTVALRRYNRRCPNYLIYWDMISQSCARGNRLFDMGRSEDGSTQLRFKTNWGARVVELSYNYYLRKLDRIPYVDPRNPRYRLPIAVWKRLPVPLTSRLGPHLIKGLA